MQGEEVRLCGVIVNPTTVTGRTATVQGTVVLTDPAPAGGTNIALSSDNPDVVKVQPSVDVPEGSNSAGFTVDTEPVNDPTPVAITASSQDVKRTATLTVQPPALAQLTLSPAAVLGGTTPPYGTVQLNGPAPTNFTVTLQSTDTAVATVPASFTVPANSTSATFPVDTQPVPSTRQVDIVASRGGVERLATLTVRSPAPVAFAFSPQHVGGDETSTGTISLNGPAPGGTSIMLTGSNATTADFPATVLVQPDATRASFTATGKTFTGPDRTVTVTASYLGGVQSATLTVEGAAVLDSVAVNPATVIGRTVTVQGAVALTDPAPAGGLVVTLSSANPAIVNVPPRVSVPAGSTTAQFTVNTEPVSSPTPITITASSQDVKRTTTLTVQPPALAQLTLNPATVLGGSTSQGTVQLNGPAPANFAVALQSTDTAVATAPASVVVPQNAASAVFPVNTRPVSSTRQINIVASRAGVSRSATLTVQSPALVAFTFNPTTIGGGDNSTGAITLNGPAPSGTSVALSRSNTTAADFPPTVPVQPNSTQVAFMATGRTFTGANRSVTVTASYLAGARSATLTVRGTKGKEKEKEEEKLAKEKEEEKSKEKEKEKDTKEKEKDTKEKEEEKVTKEKEGEFLTSGRSGVEGPGTDEESGPDGVEEGPAPGRPFVRRDERAVTGQRALDQPPAE